MIIALLVLGIVVGGAVDGESGSMFGGALGLLFGFLQQLGRRVRVLEELTRAQQAVQSKDSKPTESQRSLDDSREQEPPADARPQERYVEPESSKIAKPYTPLPTAEISHDPARATRDDDDRRLPPRSENVFERVLGAAKRWITTGNVPVKVGVVLSLFGVGFLVREAMDRNLLILSLEMRLLAVAIFGVALLIVGWRLRRRDRTYALSVQGGGIAVLYLTTFAAFALYSLLPATLAFAILVVVTAVGGALAVLQDSRALAVLGIIGGFLAPVLVSTSAGSHVVLFSYYAILNLAIVGVAWFKAWRELNVLGFLFTFFIGSLWGYQAYQPSQFATTEPFLILFVLMYLVIPVLFAHRQPPDLRGFVDGTLVFGTPLVAFGLQASLVGDTEYGLAISAVVLGAIYAVVATWLRQIGSEMRVLSTSFYGLAVVFVTVAVPLAVDARWTSAAWALEGAAMIWLGCRQRQRLAMLAGFVLQFLAGVAYLNQVPYAGAATPVLNAYFLGSTLIAAAGFISSWFFGRDDLPEPDREDFSTVAWVLLGWATAWWLFGGLIEISRHVSNMHQLSGAILFSSLSLGIAVFLASRVRWRQLSALGLLLLPILVVGLVYSLATQSHPSADLGWLVWPLALSVHIAFARFREAQFPDLTAMLHAGCYWLTAVLLASEVHWQADQRLNGIWPVTASVVAIAMFIVATLRARARLAWPVDAHWRVYMTACAGVTLCVLAIAVVGVNAFSPGSPTPLAYIPLLNPLGLSSVAVLLLALHWSELARAELPWLNETSGSWALTTTAGGLVLLTAEVARSVHHWVDVPFYPDDLLGSVVFQTALSIVWGGTALVGMMLGARRQSRPIWIGGAALMSVVVIKLFLVELGNTGTVARVVSFLGVGLLLLVVGYFAPAPPRDDTAADTGP